MLCKDGGRADDDPALLAESNDTNIVLLGALLSANILYTTR